MPFKILKVPQDDDSLHKFVTFKSTFYREKGINGPQPYIIICGPLESIHSSYVVVDNNIFKCASPTRAVDLCYKIFFVFNIDYSTACVHIWSFFQKYVYEMTGFSKTIYGSTAITKLTAKMTKTST